MIHNEFKIGDKFICEEKEWLCTDIATKAILAIYLDPKLNQSWFNGLPYAVEQVVFDSYDFPACELS